MTTAILDTTVMVHLFRKNPAALAWVGAQQATLSITAMTWLEILVGVTSKRAQEDSLRLLGGFELLYFTQAGQAWAMEQVQRLRFSHGIGIHDCLIASVAHRLRVTLYTHNLKDMTPLIGALAAKPYT